MRCNVMESFRKDLYRCANGSEYYGLQITCLFFRREAGIAFVHTTILEMLQIPRKLGVEKADKRRSNL